MTKASKAITIEKVENGFIIHVIYYEFLESVDDLVKVPKKWIAETEKKKDEILKSL